MKFRYGVFFFWLLEEDQKEKKANPIFFHGFFKMGLYLPPLLLLSPLSLWLQHILKLCNRIINHHVRSFFFPMHNKIAKSQNQLDHLVAFDQSAAALSLFFCL